MRLYKFFLTVDNLLVKIEGMILSTLLIFMLLFAFLQVILRNFFDSGVNWGDVFNRGLVLWIGFFAATIAAKQNRHLSLEVLTNFLPQKAKPYLGIFINAFVLIVCALMTKASYLFFLDQITYEAEDILFPGFPKPYMTVIFPLGFGILTFRYIVKFIESINIILYSRAPEPAKGDSPSIVEVSVKTNANQVG